jgi:hypothetical protein
MNRYERIIDAYDVALGGRDPDEVNILDLLPAIYAIVPAVTDREIVAALRWRVDRPSARRRARDRRYRVRKSRALAVAPVEFDGEMVNFLLRAEWLFPHEAHDKVKIGEAIRAMVRDSMRR